MKFNKKKKCSASVNQCVFTIGYKISSVFHFWTSIGADIRNRRKPFSLARTAVSPERVADIRNKFVNNIQPQTCVFLFLETAHWIV